MCIRDSWNAAMPADKIRIYAKWQAPEYTVSFETNGGNFIDPITVTKGDQIELPRDPEKEGDTFLGWYTDADFVKKFISESKIVEDITPVSYTHLDVYKRQAKRCQGIRMYSLK